MTLHYLFIKEHQVRNKERERAGVRVPDPARSRFK